MRYRLQNIIKSLFSTVGLEVRYKFQNPPVWQRSIYKNAPDDSMIFDVGANIGQSTLGFAKQFQACQIHAFEPFPQSYGKLVNNTNTINCVKNNAALSNACGEISVPKPLDGTSQGNNINQPSTLDSADTQRITLDTLDAYCKRTGVSRINILKIDTEGHDLEVILGATEMISAGKVDYILVEVGFLHDEVHGPFDKIYANLTEQGMALSGFYEPSNHSDGRSDFSNALFERIDMENGLS